VHRRPFTTVPIPLRAAAAALAVVPALVLLPTVQLTPVAAPARPVGGAVTSFAVAGVDAGALNELSASRVGTLTATAPARPAVLTGRRTTGRFDLVALTWTGRLPAGADLSVRVREGGGWTAWEHLQTEEHSPDPGRETPSTAGASAPLLTTGADGVQIKVDGAAAPAGLRAVLVDGGRSEADSPTSGPPGSAAAATSRPRIITRAQWGADESLVKDPPVIDPTVRTFYIHHTDTTNSYTAAQAYAQVRSVYAFHTKVRGWNDVGYNFLVDRFGRIFEGRRGSITAAVHGAHTGGFNTDAMGISVLGTFSTVSPTSTATRGVVDIVSWKAAQYFVNPRGSGYATSVGGGASKFPAGRRVLVRNISGHRDVGYTECPGNDFYPQLGQIRQLVAARMTPALVGAHLSSIAVPWSGSAVGFTAAVPTNQRWTLRVTPICGSTPVRTQTGITASRIGTTWDLRDSAGSPAAPGVYQVSVVSNSPVGAVGFAQDLELLPTLDAPSARCRVGRDAVGDVYTSAVLAGRRRFPDARTVVLSGSGAPLDGLVAAPLATAKGAPLLLTSPGALPAVVADDITSRGVTTAYVIGGTSSVSAAVQARLRALGVTSVIRLGGRDRYAVAAAVARQTGAAGASAVVVSGTSLADASAAAGPAAATGRPLLLVAPTGVPAATSAALKALRVNRVLVVGSTAAVPAKVAATLRRSGVTKRSRVGSSDRTVTAAAVATAFRRPVGLDRVVVAPSGALWGVVAAAQGRLTLFTDRAGVPAATASWLRANRPATVGLVADRRTVGTPVMRALLVALA